MMMDHGMIRVHMTREVFVGGGTPRVTYNPRQGQQIERKVHQYLSETGKALTIHGASKSGRVSGTARTPRSRPVPRPAGEVHVPDAVRARLATNRTPIVIDDFHFIPDEIK